MPRRVLMVFAGIYALAPNTVDALKIVKPETVLRWHRAGFRAYRRWKSRPRGGRPSTPSEIRNLIREMSVANPLWGAPRIHGELLKLGIGYAERLIGSIRRDCLDHVVVFRRAASSQSAALVSKVLE